MATIRNRVSIYSNLLSNCSNDRFGFIGYKPLICALQTYGLQHTKLLFTSSKPMVCVEC